MLNIDRLRMLRKERKLIQQDMANFLGVGRTTYVKYETGDSEPPIESIARLADYFSVSTDYLLDKTDDPTPPDIKKEAPATFEEIERAYLKMLAEEKGTPIADLVLSEEDKKELRGAILAMIKGYGK